MYTPKFMKSVSVNFFTLALQVENLQPQPNPTALATQNRSKQFHTSKQTAVDLDQRKHVTTWICTTELWKRCKGSFLKKKKAAPAL